MQDIILREGLTMIDEEFLRNRISKFRQFKGVSEHKMSKELGHSKNYFQGISSGHSLPSMAELFYI